jgi:hypothetical protein
MLAPRLARRCADSGAALVERRSYAHAALDHAQGAMREQAETIERE